MWRPPRWLFDRLLKPVKPCLEPQRMYPRLGLALRTGYLMKRGIDRLRFLDFSVLPGRGGYLMWRLGVVDYCARRFRKRLPRPERETRRPADVAKRIPLVEAEAG
jgi:hypothetical protein